MERSARPQRTLSKQAEFDEDEEIQTAAPAKEKHDVNEINSNSTDQISSNNNVHRSRSQSKVKLLVRSHAMREETSPPPSPSPSPSPPPSSPVPLAPPNSLTVARHKLRRDGSSQGSIESNSWSPCISRGSSTEQYTDSTGVDLEQFIAETLNRNQKDRMLLLKIEHDLVSLAKDTKRNVHKFPPMSSYQRMLVHRAAAYFGMEHNVDPSGHSVVVNTTKATRIPDSRFKQHLRDDLLFPEEPRRSILKRDSSSFEETGSFKSAENGDSRRSKSFEEREEEYEKVRRRIFNRDEEGGGSMEELGWTQDPAWMSSDSEISGRIRSNCSGRPSAARLLKVESYESKDTLRANSLRLTVSKSYSFGGYDQSQPAPRILTKQDSGSSMSSRLSPSSSGYKSQSQRSDTTMSATPSPTATPHPHRNQMPSQNGEGVLSPDPDPRSDRSEPTVVWAVTNIASVPPGSVLINPQTGQPYMNSDGSVYHFDPDNPPKVESAILSTEAVLPRTPPPPPSPPPPPATQATPQVQPVKQRDFTNSASHHINTIHHLSQLNSSQYTNGCRENEKFSSHPSKFIQAALPPTQPPPPPPVSAPAPYTHHPPHYPVHPPPSGCHPIYPFGPAPPSYNIVLQHPAENTQPPPPPPPPPIIYTPTAAAHHTHPYDHRAPFDATDLSGYMMGLNLESSRSTGGHTTDNRSGPPVLYWPHHQMPQGQSQSVPVYYAPAPSQAHQQRYQHHQPAPPAASAAPQPPPYQPVPPERTGVATYNGNDCNLTYPQSAIHMFYSPQCNNGSPPTSQGSHAWGNGAGPPPPPPPPIVTLQYPAAPTPPQNLCSNIQYTMYSNGVGYGVGLGGCYSSNALGTPQPSLPLPPVYRPTNLQMGRSPVGARGSPGMKGPHLPVYGLRIMHGNAGRLPFVQLRPTDVAKPAPSHHIRKQRPTAGRPVIAQHTLTMQAPTVPGYMMSAVAP